MPDAAPSGSSLAARCTACSTVFRVVPDQLRVSAGWVRCGRCSHVFNAADNLIDLDTGVPRRLDLGAMRPGTEAAADEVPPAPEPAAPAGAMDATLPLYGPPRARVPPVAASGWPADPSPTSPTSPTSPAIDPRAADGTVVEAEPEPKLGRRHETEPEPELVPAAAGAPTPLTVSETEASADADSGSAVALPSFVRRADRAARWRRPRVRAALAAGAAFAALLLVAQVAIAYRDLAAARWPGLRPGLEASCRLLGCRVSPPQAIEALTVESSGLLRVEQTRLYQLTVALRNRATLDLAVPALELSLTDAQGRLLSRRVLRATELGVTQPTVGAGRDLALQATLQTAPRSTGQGDAGSTDGAGGMDSEDVVVGYTIELFYP